MIELPPGLHGAHHRAQLHQHIGTKVVRRAIADGRLVSYSRTVLVQRELMLTVHTRAAAALLMAGPESALAGHTSAWLHGCTAAETNRIHLAMCYERRVLPRPDVAIHYHNYDPADVIKIDGLRCMVLDQALTDLLCRARRSTALACTDQALAALPAEQRTEFKAHLAARLTARRDPRGRRQGAFLLDLATGLPESPAESTLLLMIAEAGFPVPHPQYPVRDLDNREVWRLDFAWPERRLALEYDGYAAHVDKVDSDRARDEDLRRRGWKVLRADASDLRDPIRLFQHLSAELSPPRRRSRAFRM